MNTRVKLIRKKLNISQGDFGKRLGVTGAGISKIENGKRHLTEQMLLMICKEFNINEKWLRCGEGEIFRKKTSDALEKLSEDYQLDELDRRIIYEYISLEDKKRQIIKEYILRIAYDDNSFSLLTDGNKKVDVPRCAEKPGAGSIYYKE